MKVILQYKVIGPYNYDRIIRNIEKNYAKRQDLGQTNGKMHLILKIKKLLKKRFPNTSKAKHLASY